MVTEASDNLELGSGLTGAHDRCTWRPAAMLPMADLMAGIAHRTASWGLTIGHAGAWHEAAAQRSQRWSGWLPMALEYPAAYLSSGVVRSAPSSPHREAATPSHAGPTHVWQPQIFSSTTVVSSTPVGSSPAIWRPLQLTQVTVIEPRLETCAQAQPRQEIRGGFPNQHADMGPAQPSVHATPSPSVPWARAAAEITPARTVLETMAQPLAASPLPVPTTHMPQAPGTAAETPGTIAELIAQTVEPISLSGIDLRPAPNPSLSAAPGSRPDGPPQGAPAAVATPVPAAPPAAPAARVDINAISEKVYQNIKRRQQLERERKGLY